MVDKHRVITLCGIIRFKNEFVEAQKRLTLIDNIAITLLRCSVLGVSKIG